MRYSVIIPVYNRPDEVDELLQSLTEQSFKDFEVVIVEDGSSIPCKEVVDRYTDRSRTNPQLWRRTKRGGIPDHPRFRLHPTRRLSRRHRKRTASQPCRCFRRTRPGSRVFYRYTKGHQLLHDLFLHYRRHPGRKKENG